MSVRGSPSSFYTENCVQQHFDWKGKKMRKSLVCLIVSVCLVVSAQATILDQSQEQFDNVRLVICQDWSIVQTFTAGLTGQLEKVDVSLDNMFAPDLYPSTVSIVNVIDGAPSGSVLGTIYADGLINGFNSINFLSESIFLEAGTQYGIVLYNSDSDRYAGTSTQWRSTNSDVYGGGSLWSYTNGQWTQTVTPPDGGTIETFYDKDAVFKTYMVPEPATILILGFGVAVLRKRKT